MAESCSDRLELKLIFCIAALKVHPFVSYCKTSVENTVGVTDNIKFKYFGVTKLNFLCIFAVLSAFCRLLALYFAG